MIDNNENILDILKGNNQIDLIKFLEKVDDEKNKNILSQVKKVNFKQMNELYNLANSKPAILEKKIEPIDYINKQSLSEEEKNKYIEIGEKIIKENKYAAVTMAGGQGTRLGHNGPKGTFMLDINGETKSIFQIIAESLIRSNNKYGISVPWYIMTSKENNNETEEFFRNNNYFGYNKNDVKFFIQGSLPLIDKKGNLLINENYEIEFASNGNGSIYESMKEKGILDDMIKRDIKWFFIGTVDNILPNMVDPLFLGLTISNGCQIGAKSAQKINPEERVGVFCKANDKPSIIEYSELPEDMASLRDCNGDLVFCNANIVCNLFSIEALKMISEMKLDYHVAIKKAKYIDINGKLIEPEEPNIYKFETFMFDAYKYFDNITILREKREDVFAPIKNKEGNDSPETAIKLYKDFWKIN